MSYNYKSLQQLRNESKTHSDNAIRLLNEAKEIYLKMREKINSLPEYLELQGQWINKESEARVEIEKSIKLNMQFIQELERLKKRNLN